MSHAAFVEDPTIARSGEVIAPGKLHRLAMVDAIVEELHARPDVSVS